MARHRRRLNGPLLDRIDLLVGIGRTSAEQLNAPPCTTSAAARERVLCARERQARRLRAEGVSVNAHMDSRMLQAHARLDERGQEQLERAYRRGLLSTRGQHRVLRVARTLADLAGAQRVTAEHVGHALSLRADALLSVRRVA